MKLIIVLFLVALVAFPAFCIIRSASACGIGASSPSTRTAAVQRLIDHPTDVDAGSPF